VTRIPGAAHIGTSVGTSAYAPGVCAALLVVIGAMSGLANVEEPSIAASVIQRLKAS
jgi:flagellar motor component MotA